MSSPYDADKQATSKVISFSCAVRIIDDGGLRHGRTTGRVAADCIRVASIVVKKRFCFRVYYDRPTSDYEPTSIHV